MTSSAADFIESFKYFNYNYLPFDINYLPMHARVATLILTFAGRYSRKAT